VTSLSTNLAGDSLAFSARGYCTNCAAAGASPSTVTVVSRGRTYSMTINRLGRIQLVGQPAN